MIEFSAERMYDLVSDIEAYPDFLPWCAAAYIESHSGNKSVAGLQIDFRGLRQGLTTENTYVRPTHIGIRLVTGPFKSLNGEWSFQGLSADACKVTLSLEYHFSSKVIAGMLGPLFHHITDTMVEAFVERARVLGTPGQ